MSILYPPRPKSRTHPGSLLKYERSGKWLAQRKFNGTRVVIHVSPDGNLSILTRHGKPPKLFSLSESHKRQILSLNIQNGKEYWFDGELLDHKTKSKEYKNKIILFDVLHADRYLINEPDQVGRLKILSEICRNPTKPEPTNGIALLVTEDIWMAETWASDFEGYFQEFLDLDEVEGLMLRKANSSLDSFGQKEYEVTWMVRCRKPHRSGTYSF